MLDGFKAVIADEAHYLKNTGNKRSDHLMPYLSSRRRVILLTGTPALAKPREIYNLISIVRPDIFYNFKEFGYRYCEPTVNPWNRTLEFNGCQNAKELHFLLKDRIMIRRLKKDVLTQLPDKQRQKIVVETDKGIVKEIKELLSNQGRGGESMQMENMVLDILCNFNAHSSESPEDARQAIGKAYSLTGIAKLESIKEYVMELL
jgi:SWI/SNF-related matrix-associated actin-dependent regulator of chromatin subfamily A-like protein 1